MTDVGHLRITTQPQRWEVRDRRTSSPGFRVALAIASMLGMTEKSDCETERPSLKVLDLDRLDRIR